MYYKKIEIRSEADLPKDIIIHVCNKHNFEELVYIEDGETKKPFRYDKHDKPTLSIGSIVWYLQPVREELYPASFMEWTVVGCQYSYHPNHKIWTFFDKNGIMHKKTTDELFEYWQENIKDK